MSLHWDAIQTIIQFVAFAVLLCQVNEVRKSLYSTTHNNLYTHYADTLRWFLEKPHLYQYFRGKRPPSNVKRSPEVEAEVQTLCELTMTLFEHAYLDRENMPGTSWRDCWVAYIRKVYRQSEDLQHFFEEHRDFYVPDFYAFVRSETDPRSSSE
jgi:hypothetical protein